MADCRCNTRKTPGTRSMWTRCAAALLCACIAAWSTQARGQWREDIYRLPALERTPPHIRAVPVNYQVHRAWPDHAEPYPGYWNEPYFAGPDVHTTMFQAEEDPPPLPPGPPAGDRPPGGLAQDQTLGEEPEDTTVQFLRQQSVLLNRGDWQIDHGFVYSVADNDFPIASITGGNVTGVTEGNTKNRLFLVPIEFRLGVKDKVQAFVNVPLGWSNSELTFTNFDSFESELGIGDVNAGLSILLIEGCRYSPDVVATLACTAPTGNPDFPLLTSLTPNSVLGEGYWAASAQLLFIQTYDPVVIFYGGGYRHRFEEKFPNPVLRIRQNSNPGEAVFYQLGVGFGVNEWVTLSASFAGQYISELAIDGDRIEGTIREPMRMRFAVTMNSVDKLIEPFAEVGMTDDSIDARFGITWTHTRRAKNRW